MAKQSVISHKITRLACNKIRNTENMKYHIRKQGQGTRESRGQNIPGGQTWYFDPQIFWK